MSVDSNNKKAELRAQMAQLHSQYVAIVGELKELEASDERSAKRDRYKDFAVKVLVGDSMPDEPSFEPVTDEDRETSTFSNVMQAPFSGNFKTGAAYLLLKSEQEYVRLKLLHDRIKAANDIQDPKSEEDLRVRCIRTILGEL